MNLRTLFPTGLVEKTVAQRRARQHDDCSWAATGSKSTHCDYRCATHVECAKRIRLKNLYTITGAYGGSQIRSNGAAHGSVFSDKPYPGRGIGGEFVREVDELKSNGLGACGIHLALRRRYGPESEHRDDAKLGRVPSKAKIQSRLQFNYRTRAEFLTNADLLAWTMGRTVASYTEIEAQSPDRPLVLPRRARHAPRPQRALHRQVWEPRPRILHRQSLPRGLAGAVGRVTYGGGGAGCSCQGYPEPGPALAHVVGESEAVR